MSKINRKKQQNDRTSGKILDVLTDAPSVRFLNVLTRLRAKTFKILPKQTASAKKTNSYTHEFRKTLTNTDKAVSILGTDGKSRIFTIA